MVMCPGHVDIKTFNMAYKQEWKGDGYLKEDIRYEYWKKLKTKMKKSSPGAPGAKPYTVTGWDGV